MSEASERRRSDAWVVLQVPPSFVRGNLTKKGTMEYSWDSQDRLTKQAASGTVEYKYDLMGRRVAKRVNGGSWKWYLYDGLQVLAEGTGQSDKTYYTTNGGAIGGIVCRDNNGTKYWYHYDRLGNVMAITDSNGNPYAVYTMEAFGDVRQRGTSTGYANEHTTIPQPYQLTTKEYDADISLYYFNARWYDAATGRFLSRDPDATPEENPYPYAEANPANRIDPTGKGPVLYCFVGLTVVGGIFIALWWNWKSNKMWKQRGEESGSSCGNRVVCEWDKLPDDKKPKAADKFSEWATDRCCECCNDYFQNENWPTDSKRGEAALNRCKEKCYDIIRDVYLQP